MMNVGHLVVNAGAEAGHDSEPLGQRQFAPQRVQLRKLLRLAPMQNPVSASICPGCNAPNQCAMARDDNASSCWCMDSTARLPVPAAGSKNCYCAECLQKLAPTNNEHRGF